MCEGRLFKSPESEELAPWSGLSTSETRSHLLPFMIYVVLDYCGCISGYLYVSVLDLPAAGPESLGGITRGLRGGGD